MAFVQVKNTKGLPAVTYQKTIGITTSEMKSVYLSIPVDVRCIIALLVFLLLQNHADVYDATAPSLGLAWITHGHNTAATENTESLCYDHPTDTKRTPREKQASTIHWRCAAVKQSLQ